MLSFKLEYIRALVCMRASVLDVCDFLLNGTLFSAIIKIGVFHGYFPE